MTHSASGRGKGIIKKYIQTVWLSSSLLSCWGKACVFSFYIFLKKWTYCFSRSFWKIWIRCKNSFYFFLHPLNVHLFKWKCLTLQWGLLMLYNSWKWLDPSSAMVHACMPLPFNHYLLCSIIAKLYVKITTVRFYRSNLQRVSLTSPFPIPLKRNLQCLHAYGVYKYMYQWKTIYCK